MKVNRHIVEKVIDGSIADSLGIVKGDELLKVNGHDIEDVFDYQYYVENTDISVTIRHENGEEETYDVRKDEDDDLGIQFSEGLMDGYRRCSNNCIFCFIDQNPPGMRDTIYFKDDDARLSFLQGNYITLTNMSDHDIDRIIGYHLSPINVSFQTMNPELRCKMLNNRFAGDALKKVERFYNAGIELNGQIVLCKGINDGEELEYSLSELYKYVPVLRSLSVVPVGLSKYRDGLYPLEPFEAEDCKKVIASIEKWQKKAFEEFGVHFVHASDEWYITAGLELPEEERYDGYLQIENGVGMTRSLIEEFKFALEDADEKYNRGIGRLFKGLTIKKERVIVVTGKLVSGHIGKLIDSFSALFPSKDIELVAIRNDFFGERITVTGLLTGRDIVAQLKDHMPADRVIIPENVLRAGTEVFLDDYTLTEMRSALHSKIDIVKSSGQDMVRCLLGVR